jgi:hypothetical protein
MQLATLGGRGFSILEVQDDGSLVMVFDSGSEIEVRLHGHTSGVEKTVSLQRFVFATCFPRRA